MSFKMKGNDKILTSCIPQKLVQNDSKHSALQNINLFSVLHAILQLLNHTHLKWKV